MASHLETVQSIYKAFGAGDIPAILARLAPNVAWEQFAEHSAQRAGYELLLARTGRDGAATFFQALGKHTVHDFRVLDIMVGQRQVAAEITIELTNTSTGRRLRDEEMHLWSFDGDGLVCRFRHYADTAKHLQAAGLALPER